MPPRPDGLGATSKCHVEDDCAQYAPTHRSGSATTPSSSAIATAAAPRGIRRVVIGDSGPTEAGVGGGSVPAGAAEAALQQQGRRIKVFQLRPPGRRFPGDRARG